MFALGQFIVAGLLGAGAWGAWLGWDHTYYYDESVGAMQGPYRPAQVVACAVTVAALTALLSVLWNPVVVAAGVTVGFGIGWTLQARSEDESGLYVVGAIALLFGLTVGTSVAAAIGYGARSLLPRPKDPQSVQT